MHVLFIDKSMVNSHLLFMSKGMRNKFTLFKLRAREANYHFIFMCNLLHYTIYLLTQSPQIISVIAFYITNHYHNIMLKYYNDGRTNVEIWLSNIHSVN